MATTSPDGIRTPDNGSPYNVVTDLQTMANDVQSALVSRANSYRGTSAQRAAFTTAPTGTIWSDTNGDQHVYVRRGTSWVSVTPEDTGWVTVGTPAAGFVFETNLARVVGDTLTWNFSIARTGGVAFSTGYSGNILTGITAPFMPRNLSGRFWMRGIGGTAENSPVLGIMGGTTLTVFTTSPGVTRIEGQITSLR